MSYAQQVKQERDALSFVGLLAHAYLTWDPPVPAGLDSNGKMDFTHFRGLNIQALVIDNADGEVLAIEKNGIHQEESPLIHAEQLALRNAAIRLRSKRPRGSGTSVENWYRSELFYQAGSLAEDFALKGATLITTLEPCPFCAAALCVGRMKRVAYIIQDMKYGGGWKMLKEKYYEKYELQYEGLDIGGESAVCTKARGLHAAFSAAIQELRKNSIQDTWFLDRLHDALRSGLAMLSEFTPDDLSSGAARDISVRTLADLKKICKLQR